MDECHAENCKTKHPHKRFCPKGHDTFEVGWDGSRNCRECRRERRATPEYRERHRERYATPEYLERRRERWANDPEYRERRRERNRERWATDPKYREREYRRQLLRDRSTVSEAIAALDPRLKELFE